MKLYHGSDLIVDTPKVLIANRPMDFGYGFYLTSSYEQAKKWALRVRNRNNKVHSYVNIYDFDYELALNDLKVIKFDGPSKDWLMFVCNNRKQIRNDENYDLVIGPVADDKVYSVIERYENGIYDLEEILKRLKVEELQDQILFHTSKSLNYLKFEDGEEIYE
jgi:DNA-binding cell septation regulator SpoVG